MWEFILKQQNKKVNGYAPENEKRQSLNGYAPECTENKIINIHPSLLPDFGGKGYYGIKVHEAVIEAGRTESGCTVHLVTENYDEGPVLAQSRVPVLPNDTPESLAARVLTEEHKLLPKTIQSILKNSPS